MTTTYPANRSRLFLASCVALITTAMTFAIRAGILSDLGAQFGLSNFQVGLCAGTAFWGFTLAMVFGGLLVDALGMRTLIILAFAGHLAGVLLTIAATGFWSLFISTLFVGIANGMVEAACNPLVASLYPENKTTMLNRFHVWFPGGIVIGGLVSYALHDYGWQAQMASILLPAIGYGFLFFNQAFVQTEAASKGSDVASLIKACSSPLFILMVVLMLFTAATELGTNQWISTLLEGEVSNAILVLVVINGIMAVGRAFAGGLVHSLAPSGMLLFSAIFSTLGLYTMSHLNLWAGVIVFAIGICYFWPTMIGFVSEYLPKTGALGMSIIGGAGMLSVSIVIPFMGERYDANKQALVLALPKGEDLEAALNQAGSQAGLQTLGEMAIIPAALVVVFAGLFLYMKQQPKAQH